MKTLPSTHTLDGLQARQIETPLGAMLALANQDGGCRTSAMAIGAPILTSTVRTPIDAVGGGMAATAARAVPPAAIQRPGADG